MNAIVSAIEGAPGAILMVGLGIIADIGLLWLLFVVIRTYWAETRRPAILFVGTLLLGIVGGLLLSAISALTPTKESVIGTMFFGIFAGVYSLAGFWLAFAILRIHWEEAKVPFIAMIATLAAYFALMFFAINGKLGTRVTSAVFLIAPAGIMIQSLVQIWLVLAIAGRNWEKTNKAFSLFAIGMGGASALFWFRAMLPIAIPS